MAIHLHFLGIQFYANKGKLLSGRLLVMERILEQSYEKALSFSTMKKFFPQKRLLFVPNFMIIELLLIIGLNLTVELLRLVGQLI